MRMAALAIGLSIALSWVRPATAEPVVPSPQRGVPSTAGATQDWYGEWILASDALTLGLFFGSVGGAHTAASAGLITYVVGPQVVHGVHGNGSGIALSVLTRVGLPVVLGGIAGGLGGANCTDPDPEIEDRCRQRNLPRLLIGGGLGMLTAMVLDMAVYARRPAPPQPRGLTLVPRIGWSREAGWSLGAHGHF